MQHKHEARLGVALVGAGAFGARRAAAVAADSRCALALVADSVSDRARAVAESFGAAAVAGWREAVERDDIRAVIVATPTDAAREIALAALAAGKHVLVEKPFGKSANEILPAVDLAAERRVALKVGYNHRYHPALAQAHELFAGGAIGRPLFLRCLYGHGGRPGYEREWRSRSEISGGGELLDQGVHALDLFRWFVGEFAEAAAFLATACWPIAPVEDNAFAMLRTREGVVAQLHASWTLWKNTFSFEIAGERGTLVATGLGRSYGPERLVWQVRNQSGGAPREKSFDFPAGDDSLFREWTDFLDSIESHHEPMSSGADAWHTLRLVDALYESARRRCVIRLDPAAQAAASEQAAGVTVG